MKSDFCFLLLRHKVNSIRKKLSIRRQSIQKTNKLLNFERLRQGLAPILIFGNFGPNGSLGQKQNIFQIELQSAVILMTVHLSSLPGVSITRDLVKYLANFHDPTRHWAVTPLIPIVIQDKRVLASRITIAETQMSKRHENLGLKIISYIWDIIFTQKVERPINWEHIEKSMLIFMKLLSTGVHSIFLSKERTILVSDLAIKDNPIALSQILKP